MECRQEKQGAQYEIYSEPLGQTPHGPSKYVVELLLIVARTATLIPSLVFRLDKQEKDGISSGRLVFHRCHSKVALLLCKCGERLKFCGGWCVNASRLVSL